MNSKQATEDCEDIRAEVAIRDISPRLGFQSRSVATGIKVELVNRLVAAGIKGIEVASFVHPKKVPGMADAEQVFASVGRPKGVSLECCVGNTIGLKRAIDSGADAAWFLLDADEEFSLLNIGRSISDSLAELEKLQELAQSSSIRLGTYVIHAFGGPLGFPRKTEDVRPLLQSLHALGVCDWILADSSGYAAPKQVREMMAAVYELNPSRSTRLQIHDGRGMGLANVVELVGSGWKNIDLSLAGSGSHPAAQGRLVGGTCTEDAVQLLHLMGIKTGVDLDALIDAANWLSALNLGPDFGFVRRSGKVPESARDLAAARSKLSLKWREDGTNA